MKKVALAALAGVFAFANVSAEEIVVEEATVVESCSAFNSVYGGLGMGGSFLKIGNEKFNRFMGSALLGAGKVFSNKIYLGGEFLMDFMGSKSKNLENDGISTKISNKGFNPQIALRGGYVFRTNNMVYLKAGMAYSKAKVEVKGNGKEASFSSNQWAPVVALGGEKVFCNKFSARVEAEYAFGKNKTRDFEGKSYSAKFNKGWNVRALVAYNIKY